MRNPGFRAAKGTFDLQAWQVQTHPVLIFSPINRLQLCLKMGYPKTTQCFRKYFSHTFLISCRYVFPIFNCQSWTKPATIFRWHGNPQRLCPLRFGRKMSLTTHWANLMDLLDVKLRFFPYLVMLAYWMVYDGIWMILVIYIACVFSMPCIFISLLPQCTVAYCASCRCFAKTPLHTAGISIGEERCPLCFVRKRHLQILTWNR